MRDYFYKKESLIWKNKIFDFYQRDTNLLQLIDYETSVDIMYVMNNDSGKPQTYLYRVGRGVEEKYLSYTMSEIKEVMGEKLCLMES